MGDQSNKEGNEPKKKNTTDESGVRIKLPIPGTRHTIELSAPTLFFAGLVAGLAVGVTFAGYLILALKQPAGLVEPIISQAASTALANTSRL